MASVIVQNDFSPIYQGDTGKPFAPVWAHKDGTPENLTGATFAMKMQSMDGTVTKTCDPTKWTLDPDPTTGRASYQWQAADVSTPGEWKLYITRSIGGLPVHGDDGNGHPLVLEILPAP